MTASKVDSPLDSLSPNPVMLAPMVGLTHYAVRDAVASFLPSEQRVLFPTEMLNSRRIPDQKIHESPETFFYDVENGLCPQLLANEENMIRRSIPKLESWGARAIDINMGCPVKKALRHNYGVALMGDPAYAAQIVRYAVEAGTVPVSVKLRAGIRGEKVSGVEVGSDQLSFGYLRDFVFGLFEAGASWITLHPRTADQQRRGAADWGLIRRLKAELARSGIRAPIIGNGDVQCFEDIEQMIEASDCDRVMVGRAMIVKPWLLRNEPEPDSYDQGALYGEFLKKVLERMRERYELEAGLRRMRFLVRFGKPWVEYGEFLSGKVNGSRSYDVLENVFDSFFASKQKIIKRTELRS